MKVHYFIKWNHFDLGYYVSPARFKRNVTLVPQEIHFVALLVCQIGEPVNVEEAEALEARLRAKMAANANALNSAVAQLSFPRGDRANDSQPKYVALAVIASE